MQVSFSRRVIVGLVALSAVWTISEMASGASEDASGWNAVPGILSRIAGHVLVMRQGAIVDRGTPDEIFRRNLHAAQS